MSALRVAPTIRAVVTASGSIELACGAGSRRQLCELESPAVVCWLFGLRSPLPRDELEQSAAESLAIDAAAARDLIDLLAGRGALVADDQRDVLRGEWPRAALAIHEPTRDLVFESSAEAVDNQQQWADAQHAEVRVGRDEPSPPALVEYSGTRVSIAGHRDRLEADLDAAPADPAPLPFDRLAAWVDTALGATGRFEWAPWGEHIRRTSPSLGARHAVGGLVLVGRVAGVSPGVYRVDPDGPALVASDRQAVVAGRAVLLLTLRWPRMMWKYRDPRYYPMALLDAGHILSTARQAARLLGLEIEIDEHPFELERALELDPLAESAFAALRVTAGS